MNEELVKIGSEMIPRTHAGSLARYVLHRVPPGSFLEAVLRNDLFDAIGRGDSTSIRFLPAIVRVVYSYIPRCAIRGCVDDWIGGEPDLDAVRSTYSARWEGFVND